MISFSIASTKSEAQNLTTPRDNRAGHSEQRMRCVLSETGTPSSNELRRSGTKQRATTRGWRPFSFLPFLTLATTMLGWPPRLPETGRSNELVKWELLAFPHLGNYNPPRTIEMIQHIGGEILSQQAKHGSGQAITWRLGKRARNDLTTASLSKRHRLE